MGLEYARQLAGRGYDLVLVSNRQEELDAAAETLRAMFRRRRVVSPGFMNVWLPALIALLPGPLVAFLWKKIK